MITEATELPLNAEAISACPTPETSPGTRLIDFVIVNECFYLSKSLKISQELLQICFKLGAFE